jgi:hypothetical protein
MSLARRLLSHWLWRCYIPTKRRFWQEPHGVTSQNKEFVMIQHYFPKEELGFVRKQHTFSNVPLRHAGGRSSAHHHLNNAVLFCQVSTQRPCRRVPLGTQTAPSSWWHWCCWTCCIVDSSTGYGILCLPGEHIPPCHQHNPWPHTQLGDDPNY